MVKTTFTFQELKRTNHREIKEMQDKKFRAFIRYQVWPNHAYYRRLFKDNNIDPFNITCIEDWAKYNIPLVKKIDYKENIPKFVINPSEVDGKPREASESIGNLMKYSKEAGHTEMAKFIRNNGAKVKLGIGKKAAMARLGERAKYQFSPLQFWLSSGRASGLPSPVFLTRYDWDLLAKNCVKAGQLPVDPWIQKGWEMNSMNLFPYAPHLGWHAVNMGLREMSKFYIATSGGGAIPSNKLVEIAIITLLAGEKIYDPVVNDIVETLEEKGAKEVLAVGGYASSESKVSFAVQCKHHGPYHNVSPLVLSFELISFNDDGTYDFVGDNEPGHMCLFHLDSTGTVFEGFLLGDVASHQERGKCPICGLDGPFFWDVGRTNDAEAQIEIMGLAEKKIKGATVNLTALRTDLLEVSEVEELQIEVAKEDMADPYSMDVLNIYVAPRGPLKADHSSLILQLQKLTKKSTEVTPKVFVIGFEELVEKAGGMKFMDIIDSRPKPA